MAQNIEQATLDGQHATVNKNWTFTRATGKEIVGNHDFGASTNITQIQLTVRNTAGIEIVDLKISLVKWYIHRTGEQSTSIKKVILEGPAELNIFM